VLEEDLNLVGYSAIASYVIPRISNDHCAFGFRELPDLAHETLVTTLPVTTVSHPRSLEPLAILLQETKILHFRGSYCYHLCGTC